MAHVWYALSVRQPWAALIAAGVKTVEVRTWPTRRRGPVLIHASKVPDPRPEAWRRVTTRAVAAAAAVRGGIVGAAELVGCIEYPSADVFAADGERHLVPADWFRPPVLYGFRLTGGRPVPFFPCTGNTVFFRVAGYKE